MSIEKNGIGSPERESQFIELQELYGIKFSEDGWLEGTNIVSEEKIRENFDLIVERLSKFVKAPTLFIEECGQNKDAVIYEISRTPIANRDDEPYIQPKDFESNAALSVCGALRINIDEDENWHTDENRKKVEWHGWNTNPANKETPIHDYYSIQEGK